MSDPLPIVTESGVTPHAEPSWEHYQHVYDARCEAEARDRNHTREYPDEWREYRRTTHLAVPVQSAR